VDGSDSLPSARGAQAIRSTVERSSTGEALEADVEPAGIRARQVVRESSGVETLTGSIGEPASEGRSASLRVAGTLVDWSGTRLRNTRICLRSPERMVVVYTDSAGRFQAVVPGGGELQLKPGVPEFGEVWLWSEPRRLETHLSRVAPVSDRAFKCFLVQAPPDYVLSFDLQLPDGRPHAEATAILRYRAGGYPQGHWCSLSSSTDRSGRVSFELWESLGLFDWYLTTNGTAPPHRKAKFGGGLPVHLVLGAESVGGGAALRLYEPGSEPALIRASLDYARPVRLKLFNRPWKSGPKPRLTIYFNGRSLIRKYNLTSGRESFPARFTPGSYEAVLELGEQSWALPFSVEASPARFIRVRQQSESGRPEFRKEQRVEPQLIEVDFRPLQPKGG